MPNKKQETSNKIPNELVRGYSQRRQKDVENAYLASGYILGHLNEVVGKLLEQSNKDTDKLDPGEIPEWSNKMAHDIGYRKALRKIKSLLPDLEIKEDE